MMGFPLKDDLEKADEFFLGYFQSVIKNPETAAGWGNLKMVVGVKMSDLDLGYTISCFPEGITMESGFPESPDAGITFTSDTFHDLFLGKTNPMMALAMGKLKTSGSNRNVLAVAGILPQNFQAYREYLESKGLN
ncbi:MAG: SCP2 sterol-binding domain-containing protein [Bacillota bacterium]